MSYNKQLKMIATAGDKTVRIWNTVNGELLHSLATTSNVYAVQFTPDSRQLIAGCTDGKVKIFSTAGWKVMDSLQTGTSITNLAIHNNGKYLLTVGGAGQAYVYDLAAKRILHQLKGHGKTLYGLAMHPTEPLAITVGFDRTVRCWNLETGINTLTLFGFKGELYTAAIVNNGNRVVITETDGIVHVIDL